MSNSGRSDHYQTERMPDSIQQREGLMPSNQMAVCEEFMPLKDPKAASIFYIQCCTNSWTHCTVFPLLMIYYRDLTPQSTYTLTRGGCLSMPSQNNHCRVEQLYSKQNIKTGNAAMRWLRFLHELGPLAMYRTPGHRSPLPIYRVFPSNLQI